MATSLLMPAEKSLHLPALAKALATSEQQDLPKLFSQTLVVKQTHLDATASEAT
jgi:hypothetical protein